MLSVKRHNGVVCFALLGIEYIHETTQKNYEKPSKNLTKIRPETSLGPTLPHFAPKPRGQAILLISRPPTESEIVENQLVFTIEFEHRPFRSDSVGSRMKLSTFGFKRALKYNTKPAPRKETLLVPYFEPDF